MMILMKMMTMSITMLVTMITPVMTTMITLIPMITIIMMIPMITKLILSRFAADHDDWAISFLEGWQKMTTNGYSAQDLQDGPQSSWLGYESWTKGPTLRRKVFR